MIARSIIVQVVAMVVVTTVLIITVAEAIEGQEMIIVIRIRGINHVVVNQAKAVVVLIVRRIATCAVYMVVIPGVSVT
jgi:hypothetical protein